MNESAGVAVPSTGVRKKRYSVKGIISLFLFFWLLLYGVLIALLYSDFLNQIVLIPMPPGEDVFKQDVVVEGVKGQDEFFKAEDGSTLHGWYFNKPGARHVVLIHHGNAGNIAYRGWVAQFLLPTGNSVFLYDYRGFGKSTGKAAISHLVPDGLAAFDHLTGELGVDPKNVVNYGESIGSGVACQVASKRPGAGLILQSAIGSLPLMGHKYFDYVRFIPALVLVPDFLFPNPKLDNVEEIKAVHVPVLIIHGMKDTIAPFDHAKMIYESANLPKQLVTLPNGTHNSVGPADLKLFSDSITRFLTNTKRN